MRLLHNPFYEKLMKAYEDGASKEQLHEILGRGRAKRGMFEGNLEEGELEIGQIAAALSDIRPAAEIVADIWTEFQKVCRNLSSLN